MFQFFNQLDELFFNQHKNVSNKIFFKRSQNQQKLLFAQVDTMHMKMFYG